MKKMLNKAAALIAALSMTVGISALAAPTDEVDFVQDEVTTGNFTDGTASDDIFFEEDEAPDVIGDESGAVDIVPEEELISEEARAGIEELKKLEFNAANIRYAIYALEAEKMIWPEDYSDEELEEWFEGATMADVVDYILSLKADAGVSTLGLNEGDYINVTYADSDSYNTYIVKYGNVEDEDGSITYRENDHKDLVVEPKSGFKIANIEVKTGYYETEAGQEGNIMDLLSKETGIFTLPASVISEQTNLSPWGGGRKGKNFSISITTAKADAGSFNITEVGGNDAIYSVNVNGISGTAANIEASLNNARGSSIAIGDKLVFTVDSSKIKSVKINDTDATITNNTFTITVSEAAQNIEFTYKDKVKTFEFSGGTITDINFKSYIANVTCEVWVNNSLAETKIFTEYNKLADYIKTRYTGESIKLTFAFTNESNAAIDTAYLNSSKMSVSGTSVGPAVLDTDNTFNLTLKDITPTLQTIVYKNDSSIIVGQITNYAYLNSSAFGKIKDTGFDYSVKDTKNPAKDQYTNKNVTAERTGDVWAMQFVPKHEGKFNYGYKFDVSATALYDSTRITGNTVEVNVGVAN